MRSTERHLSTKTRMSFACVSVNGTKYPPHAIRLALGSVNLDVLAQSLDKVKRVIDGYTY